MIIWSGEGVELSSSARALVQNASLIATMAAPTIDRLSGTGGIATLGTFRRHRATSATVSAYSFGGHQFLCSGNDPVPGVGFGPVGCHLHGWASPAMGDKVAKMSG